MEVPNFQRVGKPEDHAEANTVAGRTRRRDMTLDEFIDRLTDADVNYYDMEIDAMKALGAALRADGYRVVKLVEQTNEHGVLLSTAVAEELT